MRLLRFTAKWCGPCRTIGPAVDQLARLHGLPVEVIDVDDNPGDTMLYEIQAVPTIILLGDDGWHILYRGVGTAGLTELEGAIHSNTP